MTLAHPAFGRDSQGSRWLILCSLALNLFFVGIAGALLVRHYAPAAAPATTERGLAARIDRLATSLPEEDAEKLRAQFHAQQPQFEAARDNFRRAQDGVRAALRAEPFSPDALRAAMTTTRPARQAYNAAFQDILAAAAALMSPAGRSKLAEWPPSRATSRR